MAFLGSLFGIDAAVSTSEQTNLADIAQANSSSCDINCANTVGDVIYTFKDTTTGDISFSQACTVDANCMMNSNISSFTDLMAKAANSASVKDSSRALVDLSGVSLNLSDTSSRQDNTTKIRNSINQTCKEGTINAMGNYVINADSSKLGKISVSQVGSTSGHCGMDALMSATARLQSEAENTSAVESSKKGGKGGFWGAVVGIAVLVLLMGVAAYFLTKKKSTPVGTKPAGSFASEAARNVIASLN